jgi:hypothetical protein
MFDELKDQIAATGNDRQVADLVDDQQLRPAQKPDPLAQAPLPLRLGERTDDVGQGGEVDRAAGLDRLDTERERQVRLAAAGRGSDILPDTRVKT